MNSITSLNTVPQPVPLVDWALAYAKAGYFVLPLSQDRPHVCPGSGCRVGKEPHHLLTKNGYLDATTDTAVVKGWWQQCPDANIGIACYQSGIISIDLDRHNPEADGIIEFQTFWQNHGASWPPATPIQRTAGSGLHLIWKRPSFDLKASSLGLKGVDVKDKGYIVVEPSTRRYCNGMIAGGQYWWVRAPEQGQDYGLPIVANQGMPIAELPQFMQLGSLQHGFSNAQWNTQPLPDEDRELVLSALKYIPADDYHCWLNIGMALKTCGFELDVWDEWSRTSAKYKDGSCAEKWISFKRQGIKQATIFWYAQQHGFAFPQGHFRLNDIGNSQRLVSNSGHLMRWYGAEKRWRVWDGTRWKADETERVLAHAKETVEQIFKEAINGQ